MGILNNTNDESLGSDAVINSTEGVQINPQNNTNSNNDSDTNSSKMILQVIMKITIVLKQMKTTQQIIQKINQIIMTQLVSLKK
ncbi:hypothetical protein Q0Y04_10440 [Clostridioides difficile]|nr:hypothetical protein Q0Y04_10440 [Clostridioides difficile]